MFMIAIKHCLYRLPLSLLKTFLCLDLCLVCIIFDSLFTIKYCLRALNGI